MKRKIFTFILSACMCSFVMGQEAPTAVVKRATVAPVIDGNIDEVWATANKYNINVPFKEETPTLGEEGTTTWKALWNDDGIFVLVEVNDDVWSPAFDGTTPSQGWMYDKPEVYFDVNYEKKDGNGTKGDGSGNGNGHYQFAPAPIMDELSGDMSSEVGSNGATYSFKLIFPSYFVEYFIPFSKLLDKDGIAVDRNGEIGFDVTIIDDDVREPVRNRMNWANAGALDESWNNMDDAGIITLEGSSPSVMIESISLTGGAITTDNGSLQIGSTILPANATEKKLKWSVINGTGKASISETGLLTGLTNGTVTVSAVATDGSFAEKSIVVTISGQVIQYGELSILKDGFFNVDGPISNAWGCSDPKAEVVEGKLVCSPNAGGANPWDWSFRQTPNALPNVPYIFSFVAWADAERPVSVDFEDNEANGYNRYGTTTSPESSNGKSQWDFTLTTKPTKYTFNVNFTELTATSEQKMQFMFGVSDIKVYVDSIVLMTESDFTLDVADEKMISQIKLYPNPVVNELNVSLAKANTTVAIYNAVGQKLIEKVATGNIAKFNVSNLRKGTYFVRLSDGTSEKFVK